MEYQRIGPGSGATAPGFAHEQDFYRDAEPSQPPDELLPLFIPGQQHADAARKDCCAAHNELIQAGERFVRACPRARKNLEHLLGMPHAPACCETEGLCPDEHEIKKRIGKFDVRDEGCRNGYSLLENKRPLQRQTYRSQARGA